MVCEPMMFSCQLLRSAVPGSAQAYYEGKADKVNEEAIKAFHDHKVKVITLTDAEYQQWLDVAKKSAYAKFAKDVPNGQKLIDEALAVK